MIVEIREDGRNRRGVIIGWCPDLYEITQRRNAYDEIAQQDPFQLAPRYEILACNNKMIYTFQCV